MKNKKSQDVKAVIFFGRILPVGKKKHDVDIHDHFTQDEIKELNMVGLEVLVEHNKNTICGWIVEQYRRENGDMIVLGCLEAGNGKNESILEAVLNKDLGQLSLGHRHVKCNSSKGTGWHLKKPLEVSLCKTARRPTCDIYYCKEIFDESKIAKYKLKNLLSKSDKNGQLLDGWTVASDTITASASYSHTSMDTSTTSGSFATPTQNTNTQQSQHHQQQNAQSNSFTPNNTEYNNKSNENYRNNTLGLDNKNNNNKNNNNNNYGDDAQNSENLERAAKKQRKNDIADEESVQDERDNLIANYEDTLQKQKAVILDTQSERTNLENRFKTELAKANEQIEALRKEADMRKKLAEDYRQNDVNTISKGIETHNSQMEVADQSKTLSQIEKERFLKTVLDFAGTEEGNIIMQGLGKMAGGIIVASALRAKEMEAYGKIASSGNTEMKPRTAAQRYIQNYQSLEAERKSLGLSTNNMPSFTMASTTVEASAGGNSKPATNYKTHQPWLETPTNVTRAGALSKLNALQDSLKRYRTKEDD